MSSPPPGSDPRIARYQELLRRLSAGETIPDDPQTPPDRPQDPIDALGVTIARTARDVSERFELERCLAEVSTGIVRGLYFDDVMNHVYEAFRPLIPYDRIGCALVEDDRRQVVARWGRSDGVDMKLKAGYSAPLDGSSLQEILKTGEPRIINDLEEYGREHPVSKPTRLILAEGIRSSLTCPLVAMGRPVGFLFFSSRTPHTYGSLHQDAFVRLASAVSVLLEKSLLYEEMMLLNNQLRAAQRELAHQASHDGLTGLLNHTSVNEALDKLVGNTARGGVAVLMIDVDYFKLINDQYGHQVGDSVLKAIASTIVDRVRDDDLVGRYGGEEFLVVAEVDSERAALGLAQDLRISVATAPIAAAEGTVSATVSIGVNYIPVGQGRLTSGAAVEAADRALYAAKDSGRNCVVIAS